MNLLQDLGLIFNTLFINPITNILIGIYHALLLGHIPYPLGFSIIILTIIIRIILYPFTAQQIKSAHKMQKVSPHLAALKEKHKGDKKRQQEETMKLYKEHGINPMAGCLPLLIQLPIIWSLYNVLNHIVTVNVQTLAKINNILYFQWLHVNQSDWSVLFLGLSLSSSPQKLSHISLSPLVIPFSYNLLFLLIPVLTGVLQFILSKMMLPEKPAVDKSKKAVAVKTENLPAGKAGKSDDFQTAFQNQSLFIFPVMIGFFSLSLPLGLSLYWNTFTLFGIIQQYWIVGPGGAHHWFAKVKLHGRRS